MEDLWMLGNIVAGQIIDGEVEGELKGTDEEAQNLNAGSEESKRVCN